MAASGVSLGERDLVSFFGLTSDRPEEQVPVKILRKTAICLAEHPLSGKTLEKQYSYLQGIVKKKFVPSGEEVEIDHLIRTSIKVHTYIQTRYTKGAPIILPVYPPPSDVSELTRLMKVKSESSDGSVSPLEDETLIKTAQIVAMHPNSGETAIDQYNWLADFAWSFAGKPQNRGLFWGEHLIQNSVELHECACDTLRPPVTGTTDTDTIVSEFLPAPSPLVSREVGKRIIKAFWILQQMKKSPDTNDVIYDLTGNIEYHTKAQKTSHFLSLLGEIRLEEEVKKERPNLDLIERSMRTLHTESLIHARIQLFEKIRCKIHRDHFNEYPSEGTDLEKSEYIQREFALARPEVFENVTSLNLAGLSLRVLPPEIDRLHQVISIHLDSNQLTSLPRSLSRLSKLRTLLAPGNQLTSLPPSLGHLEHLLMLSFVNNKLRTIPESFANLRSLTALALNNNRLSHFPEILGSLTSLTGLHLSGNRLTALPTSLKDAASRLKALGVDKNRFRSLPYYLRRHADKFKLLRHEFDNPTSFKEVYCTIS